MATVTSSAFTIIVNKSAYIDTSTIKVVRGTIDLIAVDSNPTTGQFSFSISSCTGCSAVKVDIDTVGIVSVTSDIGTIEISINAENVKTYTKQITVAKIKQGSRGPQGVAGADGKPGKDGTSTYTWIKYADDTNGNGLSNDPTGKSYIGFAYNKDTATESNNASDYIWAKIQGEKGDTGVQGPKGADGKTTYTWIKYSDYKDGTDLYDTPTSSTLYIGIATNKTTATESSNKTDYVWSRFKGDKGEKGEAGKDGTSINILGSLSSTSQLPATGYSGDCYIIGGDLYVWSATTNAWENCGQIKGEPGDSSYFHIKYSDDMRTFTDNDGEEVGIYIGILTDGNREDSMNFNDYKWSRFRGEQGVTGEKGQSLTKSTPQWYASTSKTSQTGGSWVESMPTIDASHYLWLRYKLDWANPTATTYTTPTLEQVSESVKEVSAKQSEFQQDLDGFKWTVSNTYQTKDGMNNYATKSQLQQTATDLTATFNNGYNQGVTQMNAEGIKVYHNQINGENYTHIAPSGFWIKYKGEDIFVCDQNGLTYKGTITGSEINGGTIKGTEVIGGSLNVEGTLTANKIVCEDIDTPKYPGVVTEDLWLYVGTNGSDDSELESGATFATFDALLDKIPKNLNGHEVLIEMSTNITENVQFKGFHGGRIKVLMKGHTLYGYVNSEMCSARIAFYSGYIGDNTNEDNGWGKIHPSKGYPVGNYTTTVSCVDSGSIALYNIDVYGADNYLAGSSNKVGMAASMWGSIYSTSISCYGCDIMGRANIGGRIHDVESWNTAAKYGWYATSGGYITLASGSHTGGTTKNYQETNAGKVIVVDGTTFVGNTVQKPTTTAPATSTTKTVTYKSNYGDTYRSTVYNNWKKDNTVRQGDYGYGDCSGLWFFGDQFSDLKGKTINKVTIKITRQSGGSYSAVGLVVRTHNYSSRPSGAPTLSSSSYGTLSLATGETDKLTITDSNVLNGIKNGTIKGFGIRTTYDSAHYAVCSGSVTVKITYTE